MSTTLKLPVSIPATDEPQPAPEPTAERQGRALLAVIEFLGEHDELPEQPYITIHGDAWCAGRAGLAWFLHDDDSLDTAIKLRRAIGGKWAKSTSDTTLYLRQSRGPLDLTVTVDRDKACTRRVTGTVEVPVPAQPAIPATTRTVETVEWDCHPLLATDA